MSHRFILFALAIVCSLDSATSVTAGDAVRVVVWDEQQPAQKQAYPTFLGEYITNYLKRQPGLEVNSVSIGHPEKGLSDQVLDNCDVLIWWGHVRNRDISVEEAERVVRRLKHGQLQLIALHSAHWATPFVMAMHERVKTDALGTLPPEDRKNAEVQFIGKIVRRAPKRDAELTPQAKFAKLANGSTVIRITRPNCCFPAYRNDGKPSEIHTLLPDHPIAKGVPRKFILPHTEMYDEPISRSRTGSGCVRRALGVGGTLP